MTSHPPPGKPPLLWPQPGPPSERMRVAAERVIEASGDGRAIRHLGSLRRDPSHWTETLIRLASESLVLKVALGVFLGIVAADAVRGLLKGDLLESLGSTVDGAIDEAGGMEALMATATWASVAASSAPEPSLGTTSIVEDPAAAESTVAPGEDLPQPDAGLDLDLDFDVPL